LKTKPHFPSEETLSQVKTEKEKISEKCSHLHRSSPIRQSLWVENKGYGLPSCIRLKIKILNYAFGLEVRIGIRDLNMILN
jgi:hypothetical protein